MMHIYSRFVRKTLLGLAAASVLPFLFACSSPQPSAEPVWNDMYEVRSYQIETVTNEIVTTVFVARYVETNKLVKVEKEVEDFGGYEFQPIEEGPKGELEFQCLDGSCGIKEK